MYTRYERKEGASELRSSDNHRSINTTINYPREEEKGKSSQ